MSKMNHELQAALAHVAVKQPAAQGLPDAAHTIGRVGIVGANPAGIGIAMSLLDADIPVTVFELTKQVLDVAIAQARSAYHMAVEQGGLAAAARDRRMALLAGSINFHHLKDCDVVIDALATDSGTKARLFRKLDQTARPGAILVSCVSPGAVDRLAASTRRAGEVVGLQLSCPAQVGQTWTLVPGTASAGQALATLIALVQHLGKACVVAGDLGGDASQAGALQRGEEGAMPWRVDQIVE
ncbi:3-hydroxyacyl-CoA dehydrogenase NAD-binding domain-containing protein [Massilia yuzhufengensis]|uniref:3-hydroxyacyl-CoA dehydrogenase n=1 Tax=Massilia yuzhufengensis TaxID=1164594 RepID=A0A1I1MXL0_9BURK|nr:3-hydroxyacyl-CoA dehydrogenase NAD-binding domain-containing protein [Massilia yuzhufengensis]SFC90089.1 3-hydroxyacyl-CoA dehydrogenase [Massilia yuzhufengensis]